MMELRPSDAVNLAGQDTGRGHLSHTMVSSLLNCQRKFEFQYVERIEPIARKAALELGKAFQKGIELNDPAKGAEYLREHAPMSTSQADEDKLRLEEAIVHAGAKLYLSRWPAPEGEQREFEYRVRLRNPETGMPSQTFDLLGYADGVKDKGAHLGLVENKFVGQIGEVSVRKLPLDRQVSLACYGLWRATGKKVREIEYRFIRKPSIKQKKDETLDQFIARLEADYENPERRDFYSHGENLFRTDEDLLRIEAELWTWAEQLRRNRRWGFWPRNSSVCHDYGGCPFLAACIGDPDAESLYRVKEDRSAEG
jgi:hypothetical protein